MKVEFEWKQASEIPTEHWERNYAISPEYLVKCGYNNGLAIIGYSRYSYAVNRWMPCYDYVPKTEPSSWRLYEVIEWTDQKL